LAEYRDVATMKPGIEARWGTDPSTDDSPIDYPGTAFTASGTRVLLAHGTTDINIPRSISTDVMKAKYAGSPLYAESIYEGHDHFSPVYWDAAATAEVVEFFGGASEP